MNYEKKYKEALERASNLRKDAVEMENTMTTKTCEVIFPELKESEDESIRKKIIEYMKTGTYNRDYIRYADKYSYEIWRKLMDNFKNIKDYHIGCNEVSDIVLNAIIDTFKWLEKGGDKNKVSKHVEAINEEKVDTANKVEPTDYSSIDPHFFKTTDKVEPKFHEGDWIVQGYNILKIKCVGNTHYCFETVGGYVDDMLISEIDSQFHLWTIADAKDGDVLAFYCEYKGNKMVQVGIIEKYVGKHGGCSNTFKIYVGVDWENNLKIGKYMGCPDIRPATKEQRDTLMKAMVDAGYTFDFKKKKLKKIEQIRAKWSEEDELSCFESALFTAFSDAWQSYLLGENVNVKQWAKEHSKELLEAAKEELKGHNSAWSEEDTEISSMLIELIESKEKSIEAKVEFVAWLKSLKQRMNNV